MERQAPMPMPAGMQQNPPGFRPENVQAWGQQLQADQQAGVRSPLTPRGYPDATSLASPAGRQREMAQQVPGGNELPPLTDQIVGKLPNGRPIVRTADGGVSTHRTATEIIDGQWYNIPTMLGGREVPLDEAIGRVRQAGFVDPDTGEKLQGYRTQQEAEAADRAMHAQLPSLLRQAGVPPVAQGAGTMPATTAGGVPPAQAPGISPPMLPGMPAPRRYPSPQELLAAGGARAIPQVQALQQVQEGELRAAAEQRQSRLAELTNVSHGIDALIHGYTIIHDQTSLDSVRDALGKVSPELARSLPETYDQAWIDAQLKRLQVAKQRVSGQQMGMQPIYGTRGNQTVIGRLGPGGVEEAQLPQGFVPTPQGVTRKDTGTEIIVEDRAGNVISRTEKQVQKAAEQKELGKDLGQLPAHLRGVQDQMGRVFDTHGRVNTRIDRILKILDQPGLPATGSVSSLYGLLGETNAGQLRNELAAITPNLGLDELLALKKAGGNLGSVTEAEHELLQKTVANLNPKQELGQFKQQLQDVRDALGRTKQRLQDAYDRDVALIRPSGSSTGQSQGQGAAQQKVITDQDIQETMAGFAAKGQTKTRQEVIDLFRNDKEKRYRVTVQ
jgi:hypothetical protein